MGRRCARSALHRGRGLRPRHPRPALLGRGSRVALQHSAAAARQVQGRGVPRYEARRLCGAVPPASADASCRWLDADTSRRRAYALGSRASRLLRLSQAGGMSFTVLDVETTGSDPWRDELVCVGIGEHVYDAEQGRQRARLLMARSGVTIVAHTNFDLRWLMLDGARLAEGVEYHDTKVMAWMLDGAQPLDLDSLAQRYLGYS